MMLWLISLCWCDLKVLLWPHVTHMNLPFSHLYAGSFSILLLPWFTSILQPATCPEHRERERKVHQPIKKQQPRGVLQHLARGHRNTHLVLVEPVAAHTHFFLLPRLALKWLKGMNSCRGGWWMKRETPISLLQVSTERRPAASSWTHTAAQRQEVRLSLQIKRENCQPEWLIMFFAFIVGLFNNV